MEPDESRSTNPNGQLKLNLENERNNNNNEDKWGDAKMTVEGNPLLGTNEVQGPLETDEEQRKRKYSLWIMYFTTLLQSVGGSIVVTGMWPYLQQLDAEAEKDWYSVIVAANPLGQLIFSPLIGWWCNRVNSVRIPSIFCLIVFILSNCWYGMLPLHTDHGRYYVFAARFLVGVSSGSITACRTFVTQGTLVVERTAAISHLSLAQALGFILGPAVQAALTPLGETGWSMGGRLSFSMYTSVGWITAFLGLVNLIFYHPKFFSESNIAAKEAQREETKTKAFYKGGFNWADVPVDYIGLFAIVLTFFIVFFNFVLLETLGTPVSIDQFGWSFPQAIRNVGFTMIVSSVVSTSIFFVIPILAQRFDERLLLTVGGMVPMILGRILFFPFGGDVSPLRTLGCVDGTSEVEGLNEASCLEAGYSWEVVQHGCPHTQTWCFTMPALNPYIVAVGYALCTLGFPFCIALSQTIFSKMIGPRPQGLWMGGLTAVSSLSRVIGPITVTQIYTRFGTIATSATATGLMLFTLGLILVMYRRLVPLKPPQPRVNQSPF